MLEGEVDWFGEVCVGGFRKCCWHHSGHHGGFICADSSVEEARFKDFSVGVAHEDHSSSSLVNAIKHKHWHNIKYFTSPEQLKTCSLKLIHKHTAEIGFLCQVITGVWKAHKMKKQLISNLAKKIHRASGWNWRCASGRFLHSCGCKLAGNIFWK